MAYKARTRRKRQRPEKGKEEEKEEDEEERIKRIRSKYVNKQHTLVLCTRGINYRDRHLMNDLRALMPHTKRDVKFDARELYDINEICDMKNCTNCLFFECRKKSDLYLWLAKSPNGPSAKFYVTNTHTMSELKFTGNCMKGSRPLLHFSESFDTQPQLKMIKELFSQVFATPYMHPKSKPFIDHIFSFYYVSGKIWFRNYQITEEYKPDKIGKKKTERALVEIGPRFVLDLIKIISGSFFGPPLYENPKFISPNKARAALRTRKIMKGERRKEEEEKREKRKKVNVIPKDELDTLFDDERKKKRKKDGIMADGKMEDGKMEDGKMEDGKMKDGKMEGKMDDGKME